MSYKGYTWDVDIRPLIPPIGCGLYRFYAKITYARSPTGEVLWKENDNGKIGECMGETEKEAHDKAMEAMRKWIDELPQS